MQWQPVGVGAKELLLTMNGRASWMLVALDGPRIWIWREGSTSLWRLLAPARPGASNAAHDGDVRSPMPGLVIDVGVHVGDHVSPGDRLVVIEAMKMEYTLAAPHAGRIDLVVTQGDQVVLDEVVARVAREPDVGAVEGVTAKTGETS